MSDSKILKRLEAISLCLPDDIADAFESMKLAILRHRAEGWSVITADNMIQVLYVLQQLAMEQSK